MKYLFDEQCNLSFHSVVKIAHVIIQQETCDTDYREGGQDCLLRLWMLFFFTNQLFCFMRPLEYYFSFFSPHAFLFTLRVPVAVYLHFMNNQVSWFPLKD